jgi:hypothetical protein
MQHGGTVNLRKYHLANHTQMVTKTWYTKESAKLSVSS